MFYYSYQHDSSRVKEVNCMNDLFCAAEQVKNINYASSPFSPEKQMYARNNEFWQNLFVPNPSKLWTVPQLPWGHSSRLEGLTVPLFLS